MSRSNLPAPSAAAFGARFGIGARELERALGSALDGAIDHADLFFEASTQDSVSLEDGIVKSGDRHLTQGVGVRAIAGEKQAFLVYDGRKRQYQLVPNLERPNLVHLNDSALLANGELKPHDKITMGRTTLLFVPLCGPEFDWAEVK